MCRIKNLSIAFTIFGLILNSAVGTEIGASHIKSGREGTIVTAVCKPIHIGKTSHVWEIKVTNDQNQLVSLVRFTTRIIERRN